MRKPDTLGALKKIVEYFNSTLTHTSLQYAELSKNDNGEYIIVSFINDKKIFEISNLSLLDDTYCFTGDIWLREGHYDLSFMQYLFTGLGILEWENTKKEGKNE